MEDEARDILRVALSSESHTSRDLVASIRRRFAAIGGIELDLPPREPIREPPEFGQ
jgi:plasmid stability protein